MNKEKIIGSVVGTSITITGCIMNTNEDVEFRSGTKVPPSLQKNEEKVFSLSDKYDYDEDNLTYNLLFSDEFDVDGKPNEEIWGYDTGGHGWGNNELQYYTEGENVVVKDGYLEIEARKEQKEGMEYTSTRLVSRNKKDFLYGKVEVRAKIPTSVGTWPAIWMLPTDWEYGNWPKSGEMDIMEHVGYDRNKLHGSVHTEAFNHTKNTQKTGTIILDDISEFHTYTVEWLPDKVKFFVDDTMYYEYTPDKYSKNITYKEWPFDKKMHILLNVAVGGNWGGARGVNESVFPQKMIIDYVRVYQSKEINEIVKNKNY